jgi:hypothetical protein
MVSISAWGSALINARAAPPIFGTAYGKAPRPPAAGAMLTDDAL